MKKNLGFINKIPLLLISAIIAVTVAPAASCLIIDRIVAVVNDEVITQREVAHLLVPIYEEYKREYTGERLEGKVAEAENMVIDQLIDDKLILSEAKRQGVEAKDKEIALKLQTIKDKFETEERFREALAQENISLSELRNRIKNDIIKSKLVRKEMGIKVEMTPSEVRRYYDEHIADFVETEKVKVYNILIKKEKERTKNEALFLIKRIKEFINLGDNFEALAKEYSEGPNAKKGGLLGLIEKGGMIKEIDDVIFSLKTGDVSDIVESPLGYHIFKVTEKIPARQIEFDAVKQDIEDLIYKEKVNKKMKKWLKELRKNAYISIK